MADKTEISWTDATWNPTVGCTHVGPECDNCYAARDASTRLRGVPVYAGIAVDGKFTGHVRIVPERLQKPLQWRRPRRIFVNSMSDLFHPRIPMEFVAQVFAVMGMAAQHQFQVLTKRPQRMRRLMNDPDFAAMVDNLAAVLCTSWARGRPLPTEWPYTNVWLGVSVGLDRYTWRADHLRNTTAHIRFISAEPLLGPLPSLDLTGIDWVIVGGESGANARPMHPDWARDLRDRCQAQDVTYHFKQWGEWVPYEPDHQPPFWVGQHSDLIDGHHLPADLSEGDPTGGRLRGWWAPDLGSDAIYRRVGKKAAGRLLDGKIHDDFPEVLPA
jgi:protein gp37